VCWRLHAGAEREARGQENRRLSLVGLDRLFELWIEHYERIDESERRLLPLKRVHFLAPANRPPREKPRKEPTMRRVDSTDRVRSEPHGPLVAILSNLNLPG